MTQSIWLQILVLVGAVAAMLLSMPGPTRCTSQVTGYQALPWLEQMRAGDLAGCK